MYVKDGTLLCRSAAAIGTLVPYCIFDGNLTSPIATWLAGQGVTLIRHVPAWREQLLERAQSKMKVGAAWVDRAMYTNKAPSGAATPCN